MPARLAAIDRARRHAALHAKHPALAAFLETATTALVRLEIDEAVHVGGFQRVTTWRPGP